nr:MAG TPA: hypothetical protein [Caudoviricetes sp.]
MLFISFSDIFKIFSCLIKIIAHYVLFVKPFLRYFQNIFFVPLTFSPICDIMITERELCHGKD